MAFIVITKVGYDAFIVEAVRALLQDSLPVYQEAPGLLAARLWGAVDTPEMLLFSEWRSSTDYDRCLKDARWQALNLRWSEILQQEVVRLEQRIYERLA